MKDLDPVLLKIREGLRKRPNLYFGCGGPRAIAEMVKMAVGWLIERGEGQVRTELAITVAETSNGNEIELQLNGRSVDLPEPVRFVEWFSATGDYGLCFVAAASSSLR